jgi:hypothetical protein
MLLQKYPFDGKRQIRLSTLSKLTTGNAFRLQWYQNHSNFHCYCYHRVFFGRGETMYWTQTSEFRERKLKPLRGSTKRVHFHLTRLIVI